MNTEYTLSIIKPDAVKANNIGNICALIEKHGLKIVAAKMVHMNENQAKEFYLVHKDRPFYNELVAFISSGPVLVQVLAGDNAVAANREIMGDTNPENAAPHTIRAQYASSIGENAVHGSDSLANAKQEIAFFFTQEEIFAL